MANVRQSTNHSKADIYYYFDDPRLLVPTLHRNNPKRCRRQMSSNVAAIASVELHFESILPSLRLSYRMKEMAQTIKE